MGLRVAEPLEDAVRLHRALEAIVGADRVTDDPAACQLHSQDLWASGKSVVSLVVAPGSLEQVSRVVAAASRSGFAIAPRGAGMSYTDAYNPTTDRTISVDMSRMDRILSIRPEDMTVTVEAGCTWAALQAALAPLQLRTPFWGPMSGAVSTIGAGLSQHNAMFGAGHHGNSSESVVALTVVLGDGRILRTGARGADGASHSYRYYGPDLAGLFCGDCGVFGIKVDVTLRLMRSPAHEDYASFSFKTGSELLLAMAEMTRAGIASEMCGFDPALTKIRLARASLAADVKTLGAVISKQKTLYKGLVEAGKIALAGRTFVDTDDYPLHVICEGRSKAAVDGDLAEAHRIAALHAGRVIENSIAKVIRAMPFPPLNNVLGPSGERFVPTHGYAPLSRASDVFESIQALFSEFGDAFARAGVSTGMLFSNMSTNALVLEPMFYWPDTHYAVHEAAIDPAIFSKMAAHPANPSAAAVVAEARKRVIAIFQRFGCTHFQIGRTYPYKASRDAASWALLETLKGALDPMRVLNPGNLGLAAAAGEIASVAAEKQAT